MVDSKRMVTRTLIVAIWLCIISFFLYSSYFWPLRFTAKSINVFAWSGMFDLSYIARFQEQTGIRVNISFYESNEELLVKLRATKGRGYDLIVPSDYAVTVLKREGLLKKLDKHKMPFYNTLNSTLLNHYFDPHNEYSVPFEWAVFGLGVDTNFFKGIKPEATWGLIFDPQKMVTRVVMSNDPLLAIPMAAFYLYGSGAFITQDMLPSIEALLKKQRPFVEVYADFRANYYLEAKNVAVAMAASSDIGRIMRKYPSIDFLVPKEGSLVTIESFALPISTEKDDLVYQFMEFMFKKETIIRNFEMLGFFPAVADVLTSLHIPDTIRSLLSMNKEQFAHFKFLRFGTLESDVKELDFYNLWIRVKA